MRRPNRDFAVFSISAVDLFASALGAFILLVMLLFPYYRNSGDDSAPARVDDIMEQRQLASGRLRELLAGAEHSQRALADLVEANRGLEDQIARQRIELEDLRTRQIEEPVPSIQAVEETAPEPDLAPRLAMRDFSILGLATDAKSFVIVVDMSCSMIAYSDLMMASVLEILEPLNESHRLAIIGFQGDPSPVLWNYPSSDELMQATPENLRQAREYMRGLSLRFAGSTPTHAALLAAMQYKADAIILLSDGQPDYNPAYIVQDVTSKNRFQQSEIHAVAIGDYTQNRSLVMFLQDLAERNGGDFVGVSR
jgi:hypothetical protein